MNILYVITVLALYVLCMLIHKTEEKKNAITWVAITTIALLCYNIFICVVLSFVNIKSTLLNLSICNIIVGVLLAVVLIKTKKFQKYYVKIIDVIFLVILLALVIFIAYKQYGFPFKIKYETTDGSTHYYYAEQFYKTSELLYKGKNNDIFGLYDSDFRLPGAYINEGILFKIFDKVTLKVDLFILFDLFILYLSGILFYYLLKDCIFKENKKLEILAMVFAVMYMCGYQLNVMIYGSIYLSLALALIIVFFLIMSRYEKDKLPSIISLPILSLLSFGIFFSYAYFIPVIYIAIITNLIVKTIMNKEKLFSEENLTYLFCLVIIPLILGLTFFIILPSASDIDNEIVTATLPGLIYTNYISNFIAFSPIFVVGIEVLIRNKKKEINFSQILLVLNILFIILLFILNKFGKVSEYYCFKAYFLLWPLVIYNTYIMICHIAEDNNKTLKLGTYVYILIYIIVIIFSTFIIKKDRGINNIFIHNVERIQDEREILKRGELEILKRVKTTLNNNQIYVLNSKLEGRVKWLSVLYNKNFIWLDTINGYEITIPKWLKERDKKYYIGYYFDYDKTVEKAPNLDRHSKKYEILYEDEFGFILERK